MTGAAHRFDEVIARLAADPGFASFAKPGAAILVWDTGIERLLWASPAAQGLGAALSDSSGRVGRTLAARDRLRALASGVAPRHGMRLEKLRLDPARLAPAVTCACRIVNLENDELVLITALIGPLPAFPQRREEPAPALPEPTPAPAPETADPLEGFRPRGTVRFVWQADAQTRFIHVSAALAEVVGPMAGDIVGQTWDEVSRSVAEDPDGAVAGLLARRETFSGRAIAWRVDNMALLVPVEWAGMPIYGPSRELIGFRGFGLLRTDAAHPPMRPGEKAVVAAPEQQTEPPESDPVAGAASVAGRTATGDQNAPVDQPEIPAADFVAIERSLAAVLSEPVEAAGLDPDQTPARLETAAVDPASESTADMAVPEAGPAMSDELDERDGTPDPATADAAVQSEPDREEGWFAGLRERVAATLSGSKGQPRPDVDPGDGARPPSQSAKPAPAHHGLSTMERSAFREIARALGARFEDDPEPEASGSTGSEPSRPPEPIEARPPSALPESKPANGDVVLNRLPIGVLVHRGERILFANRLLLDLVDYDDVGQLMAEGGIVRLFKGSPTLLRSDEGGAPLALSTRQSESIAVEVRLTTVEWDGLPASLMLIRKIPETDFTQRLRAAEQDLRLRESRVRELEAILDTATDGVIVLDETGRILSLNRSAEALFGYDQREVVGDAITVLLAPESQWCRSIILKGCAPPGVASLLNDGREVMGRVRQGGAIPLFMTMGHASEGPDRKFCAVLRDITAFKKAEGELIAAKRAAEEASAQKSDLLAKISHEIRTPLNAIIGFAEVMLEERFGPIGNERYKDYLKDVHASGAHVISLVNDLLDLAKIEAGRMDLVVHECRA